MRARFKEMVKAAFCMGASRTNGDAAPADETAAAAGGGQRRRAGAQEVMLPGMRRRSAPAGGARESGFPRREATDLVAAPGTKAAFLNPHGEVPRHAFVRRPQAFSQLPVDSNRSGEPAGLVAAPGRQAAFLNPHGEAPRHAFVRGPQAFNQLPVGSNQPGEPVDFVAAPERQAAFVHPHGEALRDASVRRPQAFNRVASGSDHPAASSGTSGSAAAHGHSAQAAVPPHVQPSVAAESSQSLSNGGASAAAASQHALGLPAAAAEPVMSSDASDQHPDQPMPAAGASGHSARSDRPAASGSASSADRPASVARPASAARAEVPEATEATAARPASAASHGSQASEPALGVSLREVKMLADAEFAVRRLPAGLAKQMVQQDLEAVAQLLESRDPTAGAELEHLLMRTEGLAQIKAGATTDNVINRFGINDATNQAMLRDLEVAVNSSIPAVRAVAQSLVPANLTRGHLAQGQNMAFSLVADAHTTHARQPERSSIAADASGHSAHTDQPAASGSASSADRPTAVARPASTAHTEAPEATEATAARPASAASQVSQASEPALGLSLQQHKMLADADFAVSKLPEGAAKQMAQRGLEAVAQSLESRDPTAGAALEDLLTRTEGLAQIKAGATAENVINRFGIKGATNQAMLHDLKEAASSSAPAVRAIVQRLVPGNLANDHALQGLDKAFKHALAEHAVLSGHGAARVQRHYGLSESAMHSMMDRVGRGAGDPRAIAAMAAQPVVGPPLALTSPVVVANAHATDAHRPERTSTAADGAGFSALTEGEMRQLIAVERQRPTDLLAAIARRHPNAYASGVPRNPMQKQLVNGAGLRAVQQGADVAKVAAYFGITAAEHLKVLTDAAQMRQATPPRA